MEENNKRGNGHSHMRSQPNMPMRLPSIRRPDAVEPGLYRHSSLGRAMVADLNHRLNLAPLFGQSPQGRSQRLNRSEVDGNATVRPLSQVSDISSLETRPSTIFYDAEDLDESSDWWNLHGYPSNEMASSNNRIASRYVRNSDDTLTAFPQYHGDNESCSKSENFAAEAVWPLGKLSNESWCSCDDAHAMPHEQGELRDIDLEAQKEPSTSGATLVEQETKGASSPAGKQGGPPGPPGGPPGLPPFSPGFPDELKVTFSGPDDPLNPKNWPSKQKWATTACIASFTFLSPLASSMIAPALESIEKDFGITNPVESQITLSIFVLAFAIGPMFLAPLSELYGRVIVSQASNIFFLIFNLACGFAQSKQQLMAFRFLSGIGGSAPLALGGGVLGDIFTPEERGKAMGLYAMGPLLGPAIGPLVGGWVAEKSTWRWMFWASSIVNAVILVCGFIWFKETYAPFLLHKRAKQLRQETGNQDLRAPGEDDLHMPVYLKLGRTMVRAFTMLFTQPIVQVMALYMGFSYGIMYLMLSTYPMLWRQQYGESTGISGLNYISLGLGFFVGAPICGKSGDIVYQKLKAKAAVAAAAHGKPAPPGKPEYRMLPVVCFSFLVPIGMLIYGWSAQYRTFWLVPNIGAFIFAIGTIAAFQCVTAYLVDTFARFAASAVAAVTILRSLMGFAFPIFAPAMYTSLGWGWGNTVLALLAVVIGIPTPILLWLFGEKLRERSSWARDAKKGPPGAGPPGGKPLDKKEVPGGKE